ncbi:MAG: lipopolysaccharide biosynthesis protein [Planctomycetes bacterium]|nr:lipopolysaccharide biosynthesis protein [Planctomycetota bacterium]
MTEDQADKPALADSEGSIDNSELSTDQSEPSLTSRVVKGVAWVFAGKFVSRGLQLVKFVVLARLLSPEDFGLFGIVMLAIATLGTFTQTGFGAALIQRRGNTEDFLDTAWTVQVIRGLVVAVALFALAPLVGWFFDEARAAALLRVMCASVVLGGLVNIGVIYFRKELEFHKQFVYDLVPAGLSLIVGVALAYRLRSVWALIWAGMATAVVQCILSYIIHPYRPRVRFDGPQAAELFRFGRWVLGSSVVVFLATHGDDALLGKLLGTAALGLYQIAYQLSNTSATEMTHLTNTVMMPTYTNVQDDRERLGRAFLQVYELVVCITLPLTAFITVAAPEIVLGLLGAKWEAAVLPLQLLAVAGFIRSVAATGGPLFVGTGRPHMDFWMNLCRVGVIGITFYPFTKAWGVAGTSLSVVLGLAATIPVWATVASIGAISWRTLAAKTPVAMPASGAVLVGVVAARNLFLPLRPAFLLAAEACVAALMWGFVTLALGRYRKAGVSAQAMKAWRAIRTA